MQSLATRLRPLAHLAPLALRLAVGVVMAYHGWLKLQGGPANFGNGMLADLGFPLPVALGWLTTLAELGGGLLLIAGLGTRLVALGFVALLSLATITVKLDLGLVAPMGAPLPGAELDVALIGGALALVLLGPGRLSADHALGIEAAPAQERAPQHA